MVVVVGVVCVSTACGEYNAKLRFGGMKSFDSEQTQSSCRCYTQIGAIRVAFLRLCIGDYVHIIRHKTSQQQPDDDARFRDSRVKSSSSFAAVAVAVVALASRSQLGVA